jgi:hypothetical protein
LRKSAKGLLHLPITPWCFALVVAVLFSCGKGGVTAKGVLPEDKMLELLSDIYVVEQKVNSLGLKRDTADLIFEKLKDKVFEKAGTTDSIFRLSMDYYIDRPKIMEGIYSQLVDSMNLREQRILSGQPK